MDKFVQVEEIVRERVEKGLLHSAIIGAYQEGEPLFQYNFGCIERQIFRLASMTKPITAVAFLKCVEMGLLSPQDEIEKYLPSFANRKVGKIVEGKIEYLKDSQTPITIERILTHSSGLGSGAVGDMQFSGRKLPVSLQERVEWYASWYLDFEPGTSQLYSGLCALDIVARIIEIVTGMDYVAFLKKYVLEPLNMTDTVFTLNDEQKRRLVPMYALNEEKTSSFYKEFENPYAGFEGFPDGYVGGVAGLFSTFEDYSNFACMLANGGVFKGRRILSANSVKEMAIPRLPDAFEGIGWFNWGYAVFVRCGESDTQPLPVGSFGWSGAYVTHFFVEPKSKTCAIMMTNMNNDLGAGSLSIAAFEQVVAKTLKEKNIL